MDKLTVQNIQNMIEIMTDTIIENEIPFCELDSFAGDGDFGMSLAKGFKILKQEWAGIQKDNIGTMLRECSMIILENCGGASGPIWGSAFSGASKVSMGKTEVNLKEFAEIISAAVAAIQKKGGAKKGDKTLLDALIPAAESLTDSAASGNDIREALYISAKAAVAGADSTREMVASKGRASYVGERSLNHPDAGAQAIGVIFTAISAGL